MIRLHKLMNNHDYIGIIPNVADLIFIETPKNFK